jgi:Tol biopolymer transport system component
VNQGTLLAVPFDAAQKRVTALPEPLIDGISFNDGGAAHFDISDNGLLVYMPSRAISNVLMTWVDRRGNEEALPAPKGALFDPAVSPDGTRLAVAQSDGEESDIWIWDFNRKSFVSRLTSSGTHDGRPVWTPDNRAIAFSSRLGSIGSFANLYIRPVDGATSPRLLSDAAVTQAYGGAGRFPASISPDGSRLYFREIGGGLGYAIRTLDMETGAIETILRGSGTPEDRRWGSDPRVSPDGRWLALVESDEIMLRAISDMESRRWNVSYGPGVSPRWSRDGTELFFLGDREMMAVSIDAGETLLAGEPAALFDATSFGRAFDVSGDGERFLMLKYQQTRTSASPRSPRIVVNWFEELKRRVPKP